MAELTRNCDSAPADPSGAGANNVIDVQPRPVPTLCSSIMEPGIAGSPDGIEEEDGIVPDSVPKRLAWRLYLSHFLSTWNSRLFEFAAVLFLASIYPDTLLPMSVYALVRSAATILFAQAVGSWVDRGNRLTVVRASILGQRIAVVASCGLFWVLELKKNELQRGVKDSLFSALVLLACVEKLCSVMNLVSVERDWVRAKPPRFLWIE